MRTGVLIILILFMQSICAQVVLRSSGHATDDYIVQFSAQQLSSQSSKPYQKKDLKWLRETQDQHIQRLLKDTEDTDLVLKKNLWVKQSVAISISEHFIPRLRKLSYVDEVRHDRLYKLKANGVTTLPESGEMVQDNLDVIDIDALWDEEYKGQGVVVAILDSGVDVEHVDLADRWRGGTNSWFDPYGEHLTPIDFSGHGTGVASIVLAGDASGSYVGVAPNAQWIAARVFDDNGNSSESAISETLQWVIDPDGNPDTDDYPDIVQNSWGLDATEGQCANPFAQELQVIDSLGIDIVFAVGNSGLSGPGLGGFSSYLTPAFDSHVISVGALKQDGNLMFSSSRGPDNCGSTQIPMLVAPGENIKTADITFGGFDPDNTTINDGTSFSSPHISGALALLRSRYTAQDHLDYRLALNESASVIGNPEDYGNGLIQVTEASNRLLDQQATLTRHEVSFSQALYRYDEAGGFVDVSLLRSGDITGEASVMVSSEDETAISPDDFQPVSMTLDFGAGESHKKITIQLTDDNEKEGSETFRLILSQNTNINLGEKTAIQVTITDDDGDDDSDELVIGGASVSPGMLLCLVVLWLGSKRRFR